MNNGLKQMREMEQQRSTQNQLLSTQINVKEHLFRWVYLHIQSRIV